MIPMSDERALPRAIEEALLAALRERRSGVLHVEFHEGGVTKGKIEQVIVWDRGQQGGRVERG